MSALDWLEGRRVAYLSADLGIDVFGTKGAAVHVQEVIRVMRDAGARVELFTTRADGEPPADLADLPVRLLPRVRKGDASTAAEREERMMLLDPSVADEVVRHGAFDLYYERYSLFSHSALTTAVASGIPTILEVNAPLPAEHAAQRGLAHPAAANAVAHAAASAASAVVCVSEHVRQWVLGLAPGANALTAPNGVNTERITPRQGETGQPGVTIGFVGTLKPWHGVEALLEAAAPLLAERNDLRLLLVGDGPQAAAIDARARELGIADSVERSGAVAPSEIPGWLHRMDLAVAPYPASADRYFSPLKVYEYLAAGLPVIASAVGQIPRVLADGETGLLVPASDTGALTTALRRLAGDAGLRSRLAAAGRSQAVAQHSWRHTVEASLGAALGAQPHPTAPTPRQEAA